MENADDGQFWSKCEPTRTAIAFEGILCFFNDCCSGANTYGTKLQYFIGFADVGDNVFFLYHKTTIFIWCKHRWQETTVFHRFRRRHVCKTQTVHVRDSGSKKKRVSNEIQKNKMESEIKTQGLAH